jgi:hypothetical protein
MRSSCPFDEVLDEGLADTAKHYVIITFDSVKYIDGHPSLFQPTFSLTLIFVKTVSWTPVEEYS